MRITLEPTENQAHLEFKQQKVVLEIVGDNQDAEQVAELLKRALLAWGFEPETVNEIIIEV